jgi:hypothetical protein
MIADAFERLKGLAAVLIGHDDPAPEANAATPATRLDLGSESESESERDSELMGDDAEMQQAVDARAAGKRVVSSIIFKSIRIIMLTI